MTFETDKRPAFSRSRASGAVVYNDYRHNFVICPGREVALQAFVNQTYGGQRHKLRHTRSSNSEDALTWSCFDALSSLEGAPRADALSFLWEIAFDGTPVPEGLLSGHIHVGKKYGERGEETEVDASIEGKDLLLFIEAKLYSPMSLADPENQKPHDQIARKLRVGLKDAHRTGRQFYFIVLDIAPPEILRSLNTGASLKEAKAKGRGGFASKWQTAYWFTRYKRVPAALRDVLGDIPAVDARTVSRNMAWLTWADVYKTVLRAVMASGQRK